MAGSSRRSRDDKLMSSVSMLSEPTQLVMEIYWNRLIIDIYYHCYCCNISDQTFTILGLLDNIRSNRSRGKLYELDFDYMHLSLRIAFRHIFMSIFQQ